MDFLFLHGALGCASHWTEIGNTFKEHGHVHLLDFPAHGNSKLSPVANLNGLSDFLADYIQSNSIESPVIIGYSMGGYVALHAAIKGKINPAQIITIASKMTWDETIAEEGTANLNWNSLAAIKDKLMSEHGENTEHLFSMTADILRSIGQQPIQKNDLSKLQIPVTMMVGEKDKMVSKEETEVSALACTNGRFVLLEAQGHALERMDQILLSKTLKQLLIH